MKALLRPRHLLMILIGVVLVSCHKDTNVVVQNADYRSKFVGNYFCPGMISDWDMSLGINEWYSDTIVVCVSIDNSSTDKIYVDNDLVPIDTNGYFDQVGFSNYHIYTISFFAKDSIRLDKWYGGLGTGQRRLYFGKKIE